VPRSLRASAGSTPTSCRRNRLRRGSTWSPSSSCTFPAACAKSSTAGWPPPFGGAYRRRRRTQRGPVTRRCTRRAKGVGNDVAQASSPHRWPLPLVGRVATQPPHNQIRRHPAQDGHQPEPEPHAGGAAVGEHRPGRDGTQDDRQHRKRPPRVDTACHRRIGAAKPRLAHTRRQTATKTETGCKSGHVPTVSGLPVRRPEL
jgi:hypothetical protein